MKSKERLRKSQIVRKIRIKNEYLGIHYNNECSFCGLNTNLLDESEKVVVESKKYCKSCYQNGIDRKSVTPKDFYELFHKNHTEHDSMSNINNECICNKLERLEIAHLCGEYGKEDCICLDLYHVIQEDSIYFRLSICDDDDPWFGTETYNYISPEQAIELLNKNGIHLLDGLSDENWKSYFSFI